MPAPISPEDNSFLQDTPGRNDAPGWPLRAWGLALLGALIGLALHVLLTPDRGHPVTTTRSMAAAFFSVAGFMFAVLVERRRILWSLAFATLSGVIVAMAVYWNAPRTFSGQDGFWQLGCGLLCTAIAAPLFQAWRGQYRNRQDLWHIPYATAYQYAWANVVLWFAAWAFVGVTWLMAFLLGALFQLIGIHALNDLLAKDWMVLVLSGAALGAAVALLRDREHILSLLQRVATTVLAVLAPVLALGLIAFIIALPFTGLTPLWETTKSTTPILLGCVIGALCLTNAVIGDTDEQASQHLILRLSALALGVVMLPLALIAAISTGSRIHQYGLTPDRIWAVVFIAIACAYGLAYLVSIIGGRLRAAGHIRRANLRLAIALCGVAFVLSTPFLHFGALSTADQLARLKNGTTPADQFDWVALRFDFGKAGVEATRRLAKEGSTAEIRQAAAEAFKAKNRWELQTLHKKSAEQPIDETRLNILPQKVDLPPDLHKQLQTYDACGFSGSCTIIYEAGSAEAIIVRGTFVRLWQRVDGTWRAAPELNSYPDSEQVKESEQALAKGQFEIRDVTHRQLFVNGQPVGNWFK
ncbi:DUF4153 domain-containing protein [Altererythrobacter indicus]|uniref:DUF4153 domain-containing protein n=1 Tax=Altericroceibacterium indicum TaxID=374177 RepID=A0A845AA55_9SPHN|nr:DUF4153 domain-containing protein [Altericroceibacterium indicum]MXP27130.1 DUF4153 domain-containing protein [Altericroceibacterium indicum]